MANDKQTTGRFIPNEKNGYKFIDRFMRDGKKYNIYLSNKFNGTTSRKNVFQVSIYEEGNEGIYQLAGMMDFYTDEKFPVKFKNADKSIINENTLIEIINVQHSIPNIEGIMLNNAADELKSSYSGRTHFVYSLDNEKFGMILEQLGYAKTELTILGKKNIKMPFIVSGLGAVYVGKSRQKVYKLQDRHKLEGTLISIRIPIPAPNVNIYDYLN